MIPDTTNVTEFVSTNEAELLYAKIGGGTLSALRAHTGALRVRAVGSLPVIAGKTSFTFFAENHRSKYGGYFDAPIMPRAELRDALFIHGAENYYHFLGYHLISYLFLTMSGSPPRIATLHGTSPSTAEAVTQFVGSLTNGRQTEIVALEEGDYSVSNVIFPIKPSRAATIGFFREIFAPFMRQTYAAAMAAAASHPTKLFVRRVATRRQLVNQAEIEDVLTRKGYFAIDPGTMSFETQVAVFSRATDIIGVEGAAMANLFFAPSTARIVVLGSPLVTGDPFFTRFGIYFERGYRSIAGTLVDGKSTDRNADFVIDPATLADVDRAA